MVVFIVGTGRCGSTMLSQMLNSHPEIFVPDELQILFEYSNNGARLFEVFHENKNQYFGPEDFIGLIESVCPHNLHEYFDYRSFFENKKYPILCLRELVTNLFSELAASQHKRIFVEQTPWYGQRIDILDELFPDAKYIHIVRDGRDVAISFARTPWWHSDIGQNLKRWHAEVGQIIDSSNRILSPGQTLQVRYEDLVDAPETGLRRISEFLGVDFHEAMLDPATYVDYSVYSKTNEKNISSSALNEWSKVKAAPTFKGSRYAWRTYAGFDFSAMSPEVTEMLESLGYDGSGCT